MAIKSTGASYLCFSHPNTFISTLTPTIDEMNSFEAIAARLHTVRARPPFDGPQADVILRSSDGVDFYTQALIE